MRLRRAFLRLECLEDRSLMAANASGLVQGVAFVDGNGNGVQDNGERPVSGLPVTLTGTTVGATAVSAQVTTDDGGAFRFLSVTPGTYSLSTPGGPAGAATFGSLGSSQGVTLVGLPLGEGQTLGGNLGF